jgi:hypothetical protein
MSLKVEKMYATIGRGGQVQGYFGRVMGADPQLAEQAAEFVDVGLNKIKEELDTLLAELANGPEQKELAEVRTQLAQVRINKKKVQDEQLKAKKLAVSRVKSGEEQDSTAFKQWEIQSKLDTILEAEKDLEVRENQLNTAIKNETFQRVEQFRQNKIYASDLRATELLEDLAKAFVELAFALDAEAKSKRPLAPCPRLPSTSRKPSGSVSPKSVRPHGPSTMTNGKSEQRPTRMPVRAAIDRRRGLSWNTANTQRSRYEPSRPTRNQKGPANPRH